MVRLQFIDLAKGVAILCVLIGHFMQYTTDSEDMTTRTWLWEFIYSFHMPLFMLLSGYFIHFDIDLERIKKRFMCLILPGFLWSSIIAMALYVLVNYAHFRNPIEDQAFILRIFKQFWFLSCLFFCYIAGVTAVNVMKNKVLAFVVSLLLLMMFCVEEHLHIAFLYPYMWMGFYIRKNNVIEKMLWTHILSLTVAFILLLMFWSSKYTVYAMPINLLTMTETGLVFEVENLMITIYRFTLGLCGSILIVSLCYKASLRYSVWERLKSGGGILYKIMKWLISIGQFTISIYILQKFTLEYAFKFCHVHMPLIIAYLLFLPASILECMCCFYAAKLMIKHKFTRILVGKYN